MEDTRFSRLEVGDDVDVKVVQEPGKDSRFGHIEVSDDKAPEAPKPVAASKPAPEPLADLMPAGFTTKTSHGVDMSPRMRRCYGALASRKIPISDWSTDSCVLAVLPQLQAFTAEIRARFERVPAGLERMQLSDLLADLEGLARRIPQNRSSNGVVADSSLPATSKAATLATLVAVSKADETTGAISYWQLSGDVELAKLEEARKAAGLEEEKFPKAISVEVALRRSIEDLKNRHVMVRSNPKGGWHLVHEVTDGDGNVSYHVGAHIFINKENAVCVEPGQGETPEQAAEVAVGVRAAVDAHRGKLSTVDISDWLVRLARSLDAVTLRQRGGIYFVPCDAMEMFNKVKAALKVAHPAHTVYEIPALRSDSTVTAIVDAVATEVSDLVIGVEAELQDPEFGARAAHNREETVVALIEKVRRYERLLGKPVGSAIKTLQDLNQKLSQKGTRFERLEVE